MNHSLKAQGNVTLDEFFDKLQEMLRIAWGPTWGEFAEASSTIDPAEDISMPRILYELEERVPAKEYSGLKHRLYSEEPDPEDPAYRISIYRQWFHCTVDFYCIHANRRGARELAEQFEQFLSSWVGYFKDLGISEILFEAEHKPQLAEEHRQRMGVRTLRYRITCMRPLLVRSKALEEVLIKIHRPQPGEEIPVRLPDTTDL